MIPKSLYLYRAIFQHLHLPFQNLTILNIMTTYLYQEKSTHDTAITLFQVKPSTPVNKPLKSEVNLLSINSFSPLPCQIISKYNLPKQLILPESFSVEEQIYECQPKINESENCNFILSAVSALPNQCEPPLTPLTWAATNLFCQNL